MGGEMKTGRFIYVFVLAFAAAYWAVEKWGLFSERSATSLEILYSYPFLACSLLLAVTALVSAVTGPRKRQKLMWLGTASLLLIVSGLWASYLTRFSAEAVITEGQGLRSGRIDYLPDSLYKGSLAKEPNLIIRLDRLHPEFSEDGTLSSLRGSFRCFAAGGGSLESCSISDSSYEYVGGGVRLKLGDFGYSPRYELRSNEGQVLDSSFVYLRLYPPGNEDYFRLLEPTTYYLRYYPRGIEGREGPVFKLRIARNKDIVADKYVALGEPIAFDNGMITFKEIRPWSTILIKRDLGEPIALAGFAGVVLYLAAGFLRRHRTS